MKQEHSMLPILPARATNPKASGPWVVRCTCGWLDGIGGQLWTQKQARSKFKKHKEETR